MHPLVKSKIQPGMMLRKWGVTYVVRSILGYPDGDKFDWLYYVESVPSRELRPVSEDEMQALFLGAEILT